MAIAIRYEGTVPQTLRQFVERHCVGKVYEVHHGGGFTTDSGNAYDVGITAGYRINYGGDVMHTLIEPTVRDVISRLRTLEPCHDCDECREAWANGKAAAR